MIDYSQIDLAVLLLISLIYAAYDVFNRRNVPNSFVYFTILIGIVMALLSNSGMTLVTAFVVAIVVGAVGYTIYKAGLLGAGDVLEFVFIALAMPVWQNAFFENTYQWNIPFVLSVIIAAGYASLIFIPIYYLLVKKPPRKAPKPNRKRMAIGTVFFIVYMIFILAMRYLYDINVVGSVLIFLLAFFAGITMIYDQRIYLGMVEFIYPSKLEEGDMIATNLMSKKDLAIFQKKTDFGRLASDRLIAHIKNVRVKLPVYRDSVPFSLFIFIGVLISLAYGNIILLMIGI